MFGYRSHTVAKNASNKNRPIHNKNNNNSNISSSNDVSSCHYGSHLCEKSLVNYFLRTGKNSSLVTGWLDGRLVADCFAALIAERLNGRFKVRIKKQSQNWGRQQKIEKKTITNLWIPAMSRGSFSSCYFFFHCCLCCPSKFTALMMNPYSIYATTTYLCCLFFCGLKIYLVIFIDINVGKNSTTFIKKLSMENL